MNSMMTKAGKQTKRLAGLVAVVATMFTFGGTLSLAEHYSKSGMDNLDYLAAVHQAVPVVQKDAA